MNTVALKPEMKLSTTSTTATSCLFSFFISFYILLSFTDQSGIACWSSFVPLVLVAFFITALLIVAVRTTIVTWITVLVILACAGKRRRVLVVEGRKITADVAMYLFQVVINERGLVAIACATLVSSLAMALF